MTMSEESFKGMVPPAMRGVIKGNAPKLTPRIGGDMTNTQYAKENSISKRQASKKRRGY
jgi:hypothetical protein